MAGLFPSSESEPRPSWQAAAARGSSGLISQQAIETGQAKPLTAQPTGGPGLGRFHSVNGGVLPLKGPSQPLGGSAWPLMCANEISALLCENPNGCMA